MRFELSIALKYLVPRLRQLSVSIISLISVLVITLVVWLVVVFLSVTHGIEKKWLNELVALNAPLRMTPTEAYYNSYYYLIDNYSEKSGFSTKTLQEKLSSETAENYDPTSDLELPPSMPRPDKQEDGTLKNIAKEAFEAIDTLHSFGKIRAQEYEVTFGNLKLDLVRKVAPYDEFSKSFLTQVAYVTAFDTQNERLQKLLLLPTNKDTENIKGSLERIEKSVSSDQAEFTQKIDTLFDNIKTHHIDSIPSHDKMGEGILISKSFQKNGVLIGDRGTISYYAPSMGSMQEMYAPIYVAGFYDPGLMPVGNRMILAPHSLLSQLRSHFLIPDTMLGNGFNIWLDDLESADQAKEVLKNELEKRGLSSYFKVESFSDYEFSKPLLEQLKSDKNLFTLIAVIILIVACSNIISMLILLVNDKKKEIGILQSLGLSSFRIGTIFGLCGFLTGLMSSALGIVAASVTLHNLQHLVNFLSFMQGHEAFQAAFFGSTLPNEVSGGALAFVLVATTTISLLAGLVPAIKAAKIRPSETLRKE